MMFEQVKISPTLEVQFGENFRNKWNLSEYSNPNAPAIFFGLYREPDLECLLNHKGPALVIWGGGDMRINHFKVVKPLIDSGRCFTCTNPGHLSNSLTKYGIKHKPFYIAIKDYSKFTPSKLGDKIYVYRGWKGNRNEYFKWEEMVLPIIEHFGEDRVIYTDNVDIDTLLDNYYKECFVYVKPVPKGGCTTMWELGHMGIKTISTGQGGLPNVLEYKNINHIIQLIEREEFKIGTIQNEVAESTRDAMVHNNEWLKINYWK